MKKLFLIPLSAAALLLLLASPLFAAGLDDLHGKWTLKGTNETGVAYTQTLEIKDGKFTFAIVGPDKKVSLYAKGDVKVETTHSLNVADFSNIEGGKSADELNPVDDDRHCVYFLDGSTLSLAIDFDKDRNKTPRVEVYTKSSE
jgi:hypothetical protein